MFKMLIYPQNKNILLRESNTRHKQTLSDKIIVTKIKNSMGKPEKRSHSEHQAWKQWDGKYERKDET